MNTAVRMSPAGCILLALLAVGCGGTSAAAPAQPGPERTTAEQYEALYLARLDSARSRYTEADVRFMRDMIHHHSQALEMAAMVPDRTENPGIRTLAARITNAQTDEIAIMRRWLEDRGEAVPDLNDGAGTHAGMAHGAEHPAPDHSAHHAAMPGMLTPEELHRLEQSRGEAFDRLFLSSMIRHHQGAVVMVRELFATDGAAQDDEAFKFASDAQVDQATEVARMESMLAELTQRPRLDR